MSVMDEVQAVRAALEDVPVTLLATEETRVFGDISSSLDIFERFQALGRVVVLVGPTGAGKSYVFNALVRPDASPEGVLRPTTSTVVVAGEPPSSLARRVPDHVVVPGADVRFIVVDTPVREADPSAVAGAVAGGDLAVMVVSPIRYADASVMKLWREIAASPTALVLNRMDAHGPEAADLLSSVADVFGVEPYVVREGGEGLSGVAGHLAAILPRGKSDILVSIMARTAVAGTRFVVRAVVNAARDIEKVQAVVDQLADCVEDLSTYPVQVAWEGTRDEMVASIAREIRDRDDDIVRGCGTELGERVLAVMDPWDEASLVDSLDGWHERCGALFTDRASIRWRRSSAQQMIGRFSWSTAINAEVAAPKRFSRIMGARLDETTREMRSELESLLCGETETRTRALRTALTDLGDYQPGALAAAADALDPQASTHG